MKAKIFKIFSKGTKSKEIKKGNVFFETNSFMPWLIKYIVEEIFMSYN